MNRFEDRVVLLTGAARGIGGAAAELFAREGAQVIVTDHSKGDACSSIEPLVKEGLKLEAQELDVREEEHWQHTIDGIMDRFGRLDVLVNNAGVGWAGSVEECSLADWQAIMAVIPNMLLA